MKMATCKSLCLLFTLFINFFHLTVQKNALSLSFPLTFIRRNSHFNAKLLSSPNNDHRHTTAVASSTPLNYPASFKNSMALIASMRIGTPPQIQQMVLDTGSQLPWIQCYQKNPNTPTASFDSSNSSSFSNVSCKNSACPISDYSLGAMCDPNNSMCRYAYFYADGTLAEGNLVKDYFSFSTNRTTTRRSLTIGCASQNDSSGADGILGMNLGKLSFITQTKVTKFSHCVPHRSENFSNTGSFYLGDNPNYDKLQYVDLLTYSKAESRPNLDTRAYTVPLVAIRINGNKLNINATSFRPDAGGSGQTVMDSASQYTHIVEDAYWVLWREVVRLAGRKLKKGGDLKEMCFNGNSSEIGRMIGELVFEFGNGVKISIPEERTLDDVGHGVSCFGIKSGTLDGSGRNIIGNFHQQNLWVEYDVLNKRVGFGKADCSKQRA